MGVGGFRALSLLAMLGLLSMAAGTKGERPGDGDAIPKPATVVHLTTLSGPGHVSPDCVPLSTTALEPHIAVDPKDPNRMVAVWLVGDVGTFPPELVVVARSSQDGGETWSPATSFEHLLKCGGGPYSFQADPWVDFGGDGVVYLSMVAVDLPPDPGNAATRADRIIVSVSLDGGLTWATPTAPGDNPLRAHDHALVAADPRRPCTAYVAWTEYDGPAPLVTGVAAFSRTHDCGGTWSNRTILYRPLTPAIAFGRVLVASDGSLLAIVEEFPLATWTLGSPDPALRGLQMFRVFSLRSLDQGTTWSTPVKVADVPVGPGPFLEGVQDPEDSNVTFAAPEFFSASMGPDGTAFVAYHAWESVEAGRILLSISEDVGSSWSPPTPVVEVDAQAFSPTVQLAGAGNVGVTFYDFSRDIEGDDALSTDVWFAVSGDRGASWRIDRVTPSSFDMRLAPAKELGVSYGLAAATKAFFATFTATEPLATNGPSDVFFARLSPAGLSGGH